jgi:hypothetical protein
MNPTISPLVAHHPTKRVNVHKRETHPNRNIHKKQSPVKTPTPPVVPFVPVPSLPSNAPIYTTVPGPLSNQPLQDPTALKAPTAEGLVNAAKSQNVIYAPGGATTADTRSPIKYDKEPALQINAKVSTNGKPLTTMKATTSLSPDNAQQISVEGSLYGGKFEGANIEYQNRTGLVNPNNGGRTAVGFSFGGGVRNTTTAVTNTKTTEEQATITTLKDGMTHSTPFIKTGSSSSTSNKQELLPYVGAGLTATGQLSPQTDWAAIAGVQVQPGGTVVSGGARINHFTNLEGSTSIAAQVIGHQSLGNDFATGGGKTAYGVSAGVTHQFSNSASGTVGLRYGTGAGSGTTSERQTSASGAGLSAEASYSQKVGNNITITPSLSVPIGGNGNGVNGAVNVGISF